MEKQKNRNSQGYYPTKPDIKAVLAAVDKFEKAGVLDPAPKAMPKNIVPFTRRSVEGVLEEPDGAICFQLIDEEGETIEVFNTDKTVQLDSFAKECGFQKIEIKQDEASGEVDIHIKTRRNQMVSIIDVPKGVNIEPNHHGPGILIGGKLVKVHFFGEYGYNELITPEKSSMVHARASKVFLG